MTNWGNLDRIRHDQSWLAEGRFSVTNLGNLDRIRHDQRWLAEGGFSVTNLGNLDRIRHDQCWLAEAIPTDSHVVATTNLGTIGPANCVCSNFARPREVQNHVEWLPKLN